MGSGEGSTKKKFIVSTVQGDKFRRLRSSDHVARIGEDRITFKMLTDQHTGRENNIRIDLKEIGINARNWVDSAQDRDC